MRIPFPAKVFLSYVAVLAVAAVPTYFYLQLSFEESFEAYRATEIASRVESWSSVLSADDDGSRLDTVRRLSESEPLRVTYIDSNGTVLFDSNFKSSEVESQRKAEEFVGVQTGAMGSYEFESSGVFAHRRLDENGDQTLFVASRIGNGKNPEVIRMSYPTDRISDLTSTLISVFRNSQAGGLSAALLLSLLAAFVFLRPLQRLVASARAMTSGDFDSAQKWDGYDEIGDVGNALNDLARQLRQKLYKTGLKTIVWKQALEFSETPAVIIARDEVLFINGAFREMVGDGTESDVLARILGSKKWAKSRSKAAESSQMIPLEWVRDKVGFALSLRALASEEEGVFLISPAPEEGKVLPLPEDVELQGLVEVLAASSKRSTSFVDVNCPEHLRDVNLVDVGDRVPISLAAILDSTNAPPVDWKRKGAFLTISFDCEIEQSVESLACTLLHPIGGDVFRDEGMTCVRLSVG